MQKKAIMDEYRNQKQHKAYTDIGQLADINPILSVITLNVNGLNKME